MIIYIEQKFTLKRNEPLDITATKQIKPRSSWASQASSYDNENTSQLKPSNIKQIQQQHTKSVSLSERNTQICNTSSVQ